MISTGSLRLIDETTPAVSNGAVVPVSSLSQGDWQLVVTGTDWAGNTSVALAAFKVIIDIQPPRTSLRVGAPSFGSSPVYATSATLFGLAAVDDLLVVGDGIGLGVSVLEDATLTRRNAVYLAMI